MRFPKLFFISIANNRPKYLNPKQIKLLSLKFIIDLIFGLRILNFFNHYKEYIFINNLKLYLVEITPILFLPVLDQNKAKDHSADMGKMRNIIAGSVRNT